MPISTFSKIKSVQKVNVSKPPNEIIMAGNRKVAEIFDTIFPVMKDGQCQTNSICIVEAMFEKGRYDWHIVPGFGFNPHYQRFVRHVWVRNGSNHYDPTWSLKSLKWNVEKLTYFQAIHNFTTQPVESKNDTQSRILDWGNEILNELNRFAISNNINLK